MSEDTFSILKWGQNIVTEPLYLINKVLKKQGLLLVTYLCCFDVVPIRKNVSCHSKISHFRYQTIADQNVPGGEVTMNTLKEKRGESKHVVMGQTARERHCATMCYK